MLQQRSRGASQLLLLCQAFLAGGALLLAAGVSFRFGANATRTPLGFYMLYWSLAVLGLVLEFLNRGRERAAADLSDRSFLRQHSLSVRQTVFAVGALLLYLAVARDEVLPRTVLLLFIPLLYLALLVSNYWLPRKLASWFFDDTRQDRAVLIGPAERAHPLRDWLEAKAFFGFRAVGIVNDAGEEAIGLPWLGSIQDLPEILAANQITHAVLLELPESSERHEQLMAQMEGAGIRVMILSNLEEKLGHPAVHFEDGGLSFIATREEPLENLFNQFLKRTLDLVISIPAVCVVLPPFALLVWAWQRVVSPGPLFYRQVRAGIQNREFVLLKFRRMHVQSEEEAREGKLRTIPGGRILRFLQIDELPQFINVLKGEMSLVGPRPHRIEHNQKFASLMARFPLRARVKPGMTGLAQVRGFRGEVSHSAEIAHRLQSDLEYVENWRLALDITILFRTVLQVVLFTLNTIITRRGRAEGGQVPEQTPEPARNGQPTPSYITKLLRTNVRRILGVRFFTGKAHDAVALAMQGGLMVAPSAPVLLGIEKDSYQRAAVLGSNVAITDSGLMVLWWQLMTGDRITRVSGLTYLKLLLEQPELRQPGSVLWVMPNVASMERNLAWLQAQGFPVSEKDCYLAPQYQSSDGEISDPALVALVMEKRPKHIIMGVGGGVQEKLGASLHKALDYNPAIHCTGAAIGFLSGDQIRIPMWMDRLCLGWLARCIDDPKRFVPRYWEARKLVSLMFRYHGRLPMADVQKSDTSAGESVVKG